MRKDPPRVLGHRGAPRAAGENTLPAFAAARAEGADGVELDVHRSADGALVVHHDAAVGGFGVLAERTLAEIRDHLPSVPTLEEVLDACAGLLVNIEVKNSPQEADFDPDERAAAEVVELVRARGGRDDVLVSSFHLPSVDRVRALDPSIRTGYLVTLVPTPLDALEIALEHGHGSVHPFVGALGPAVAEDVTARARALGIEVIVWTVNDEAEIARLGAAGVDAIITDAPALALRALGRA